MIHKFDNIFIPKFSILSSVLNVKNVDISGIFDFVPIKIPKVLPYNFYEELLYYEAEWDLEDSSWDNWNNIFHLYYTGLSYFKTKNTKKFEGFKLRLVTFLTNTKVLNWIKQNDLDNIAKVNESMTLVTDQTCNFESLSSKDIIKQLNSFNERRMLKRRQTDAMRCKLNASGIKENGMAVCNNTSKSNNNNSNNNNKSDSISNNIKHNAYYESYEKGKIDTNDNYITLSNNTLESQMNGIHMAISPRKPRVDDNSTTPITIKNLPTTERKLYNLITPFKTDKKTPKKKRETSTFSIESSPFPEKLFQCSDWIFPDSNRNTLKIIRDIIIEYIEYFNTTYYDLHYKPTFRKWEKWLSFKYKQYIFTYKDYDDQMKEAQYNLTCDPTKNKHFESIIILLREEKLHELQKIDDNYTKLISTEISNFHNYRFSSESHISTLKNTITPKLKIIDSIIALFTL